MTVSEELGSRHEVRLGAGARTFVAEDRPAQLAGLVRDFTAETRDGAPRATADA